MIISNYSFDNCPKLTDVYFNGTEYQWKSISVGTGNDDLLNATIHFKDDVITNPSGVCGDNLTWSYDTSTYTLTISGTGAMEDFTYNDEEGSSSAPWFLYKKSIKEIKFW